MRTRTHTHWLVLKTCGRYNCYKKGQVLEGWRVKTLEGTLGGRKCSPPEVKWLVDSGCIKQVFCDEAEYLQKNKPKPKKRDLSSKQKLICNYKKSVIY